MNARRFTLTVAAVVAATCVAAPGVPASAPVAAGQTTAGRVAGAPPGSCRGALPVTVRLPTRTARALERLGFVRTLARGRVRDLHVMLKRDGRMVAQGARAGTVTGAAPVRLTFTRNARPGRVSLVVTGRRAGCAARRTARRSLVLDGRDLPVALRAGDSDAADGRLAVTLRRTGAQPVTDLRLRVLDARGATIARHAREAPLGEPLRIELAPREHLAAGRYGLLVTATVGGRAARAAAAATIEVHGGPAAALDPGDSPGPPAPPAGAVVQHATVSWSEGRFAGADSAGLSIPGIGDAQLVCRPDTQWLRVFPADRSRDAAMVLWTSRAWDGGGESSLREAQMTPFTGPDFNEGLNKFTPAEKHSHGSFRGVVGDGLAPAGTFGPGRSPSEVQVTWSWDFSDPATSRCDAEVTVTSQGPGAAAPVARGLSLGWNGESGVPSAAGIETAVEGLGSLQVRCDPRPEGARQLTIEPQAAPAGVAVTVYEASERTDRALSAAPYVVALPNNGLVEVAVQGAAASRIALASRWKVNDPDPALNFCRLWGIAVAG